MLIPLPGVNFLEILRGEPYPAGITLCENQTQWVSENYDTRPTLVYTCVVSSVSPIWLVCVGCLVSIFNPQWGI
jgi:hypothetical protein